MNKSDFSLAKAPIKCYNVRNVVIRGIIMLDNINNTENSPNSGDFNKILDAAKGAYTVPSGAFDSYLIKKGLREPDGTGVMAGVTNIGSAHGYVVSEAEKTPVDGKLLYRGVDMTSLINGFVAEDRYGFEECIYLLLFGKLPTANELDNFKAILASRRHLPRRFTEDVLLNPPSPSIMNKMSVGVLSLYSYDENPDDTSLENMLRQCIDIIAKLPIIAAHSYAVYRSAYFGKSLNLHKAHDDIGTAQNFLRILRSNKQYTEEEAKLLDLCMVIQAEHGGGNNSTFSCRVLSSSGTDTYSAIGAAIGSLKGPLHGGANIKVQEMFDCVKANVKDVYDDDEVKAFITKILKKEAFDGKGLVYGMGHAIYTLSDPRAVMLKKYAESLAVKKGYGDDFKLLEAIERVTPSLFNAYKGTNKAMCANVDLYSGLVYRMLEIPTEMYTPLFAIARVSGWCAHRIEEYHTAKKIIRPAYKFIAPTKKYIPIDERV